jgi:hypothetical protein
MISNPLFQSSNGMFFENGNNCGTLATAVDLMKWRWFFTTVANSTKAVGKGN